MMTGLFLRRSWKAGWAIGAAFATALAAADPELVQWRLPRLTNVPVLFPDTEWFTPATNPAPAFFRVRPEP